MGHEAQLLKNTSVLKVLELLGSPEKGARFKDEMLRSRGAESEPESESLGVMATSQELESGSESIKLPRLRLLDILFESVIKLAYAGESLDALFGNSCADIAFESFWYQGRSQRCATDANAPERLSGAPRTSYSFMPGRRSEFSWDAY